MHILSPTFLAPSKSPPLLPFQQIEEANSCILLLLWNMADSIVTSSNSSTSSLNPTRIICHVCQKQFSQYTCPRCNSRYCSLQCYKVSAVVAYHAMIQCLCYKWFWIWSGTLFQFKYLWISLDIIFRFTIITEIQRINVTLAYHWFFSFFFWLISLFLTSMFKKVWTRYYFNLTPYVVLEAILDDGLGL